MALPESPCILRFGVFEVDLHERELRKSGLRVRLHDQPFEVLATLIESVGEVVTREELHQRIWPDGTFVDFDSGLNTAINKLREALGDSATSPRFIETVPRRGYRFLAPVNAPRSGPAVSIQLPAENLRDILLVAAAEEKPAAHPPHTPLPARLRWWVIPPAFALGLLAGWGLVRFHQHPATTRVLGVEINPPEGGQFDFGLGIGGIALAPKGRTAAFVVTKNGQTSLWLRPLDGSAARPLAGTEGAIFPFWSPDSKSIAFFAAGKLQQVDVSGGTATTICDAHRGWGGTWSRDGQIIFGEFGSGLRRVSASGGTPVPLTTLDTSRGDGLHLWPQALPGDKFLFFVQSHKRENSGIYVASIRKPNERVHVLTTDARALYARGADAKDYLFWQRAGILTAQEFDIQNLKLVGDVHSLGQRVAVFGGGLVDAAVSEELLLCGHRERAMQLTWFDSSGQRTGLLSKPGEYVYFRLSPNGRRIAAIRDKAEGRDLWIIDSDRGGANRLTSSPGQKGYPVWSSQGSTVLFASSAPYNLFSKPIEGSNEERRLTYSSNYQVPNDASRGGQLLLYAEIAPNTGFDLWILSLTPKGTLAGEAPRPYLRSEFNESNGRFSPEPQPRLLAYESDESGHYEVYVDTLPEAHEKVAISMGGGRYPHWSPDGRKLFYISPDQSLTEVRLKPDKLSVHPSSPRKLFTLPTTEIGLSPYEVAPDGQHFLVRATPEGQAGQPLTLLVDWTALLKKQEGAK